MGRGSLKYIATALLAVTEIDASRLLGTSAQLPGYEMQFQVQGADPFVNQKTIEFYDSSPGFKYRQPGA